MNRSAGGIGASRWLGACVAAIGGVGMAQGQSATMYLMHNDEDGVVVPGQTIRLEMWMDWTGVHQICWLLGSIDAVPGIGLVGTMFGPWPGYHWGALCTPGTPSAGGIESFDLGFTPVAYSPGFVVPSASKWPLAGSFMSWDWTAPAVSEATRVEFRYREPATQGGVWGTPLAWWNPIPLLPVQTSVVRGWVIVDPDGRVCRPDLTASGTPGSAGYGVPDGLLNAEDFFYFLSEYASGNVAACDLTTGAVAGKVGYGAPNGVLNSDDFFYYLTLFASGC